MNFLAKMFVESNDIKIYRPQFKKLLGTANAALLLNQMIYWWNRSNFQPFYKFKEPCNHTLYKPSDSWCEELEFSVREFDGALRKLEEWDLVSHRRDHSNLTYYTVHPFALAVFLKDAFSTQKTLYSSVFTAEELADFKAKLQEKNLPESERLGFYLDYLEAKRINKEEFRNNILSFPKPPFVISGNNKMSFPSYIQRILSRIHNDDEYSLVKGKTGDKMKSEDLAKKIGGNAAFAEQMQKHMPKKVPPKKPTKGAVILAWKRTYAEYSKSFVGNLTQKEEALLGHIFKAYPNEAADIVEYCIHNWGTFRNTVLKDKGLNNGPSVPTIIFLSTYREIAHKVYTSGGATENNNADASVKAMVLPSIETLLD